jgi:hypothetical protein
MLETVELAAGGVLHAAWAADAAPGERHIAALRCKAFADRLATVADGARCSLAEQQQRVIGSVLAGFDDQVQARASGPTAPVEPYLVAPIVELADGRAQLDADHADKQPDWTVGAEDSGASPADRIDERREG